MKMGSNEALTDYLISNDSAFVSLLLDHDGEFVCRIEGVTGGPFEGTGKTVEEAQSNILTVIH